MGPGLSKAATVIFTSFTNESPGHLIQMAVFKRGRLGPSLNVLQYLSPVVVAGHT
jgi:hypothetical protein